MVLQMFEQRRQQVVERQWIEQRGEFWDQRSRGRAAEEFRPTSLSQLHDISAIHWTAYSCLHVIASKIAEVDWALVEDGQEIEPEEHFLAQVLAAPNPQETAYELRYRTAHNLMSSGNAPWEFVTESTRGASLLNEIWSVMPKDLEAIEKLSGGESIYIFNIDGEKIAADSTQILHFKTHNPNSLVWGMPPLESLRTQIKTDLEAINYNHLFFINSAIPDGLISIDSNITKKVADGFIRDWEKRFKGSRKAHTVAVLGRGAKFQPTGLTQRDMDFFAGLEHGKKAVQEIFGVPDVMLGRAEGPDRAASKEARESFYMDVIMPIICHLEDKLTMGVVRRFDPSRPRMRVKFKVDLTEAQMMRQVDKMKLGQEALKSGVPLNVVLQRYHNLPRVDHPLADEPLISSSLIPLRLIEKNRSVLEQGDSSAAPEESSDDDL